MHCRLLFSLAYLAAVSAACAAVDPRGDNPDARLLPAEEERALFQVAPGFEVQLVAAEPEIAKPLNLNFDAAGRLWVTSTRLYPWPARRDARGESIASFQRQWDANALAFRAASTPPEPAERGIDTVSVLGDFDPATGRARKASVFADGLNIPVGVVPLPRRPGARGDAVIVHSIPGLWRLEDTDGDGRADRRELLYGEFGFKDTHGMASSFTYWHDGWVYGTHGFANRSEVRDREGRLTVLESGNTYRFRPDGSRFEVWAHGQTNPFGLAFDDRGDVYTADSHSKPVYLLIHRGYYEGINKQHDGLGFAPPITLDNHGSSAIAGVACYAATQFPAEYHGNLFNGNPVTRRVNRVRLEWRGSTPVAVRMPDFLASDDPSFRPVQIKLGPDGALWIADFYNPIIGHYEVPLTHPNRDRGRGRIWRIVWRGTPGSPGPPPPPDLAQANGRVLAEKLQAENLVVRTLAANELVDRIGAEVGAPALRAAIAATTRARPDPFCSQASAFVLERYGALGREEILTVLREAEEDDDSALAAVRVLAGRPELEPAWAGSFPPLIARTKPGHLWRAIADLFSTHCQDWQGQLILGMLSRTPASDMELVYALKLALKAWIAIASPAELAEQAAAHPNGAERLADAALAVRSPGAARFLLGHLARTNFTTPRAGEFARHAVQHLPADELSSVSPLLGPLAGSPAAQRLALAEGLAACALLPGRSLPAEAADWMRRTLVVLIGDQDANLARRAVEAVRDLSFPEKNGPLRAILVNPRSNQAVRLAAVRSLAGEAEDAAALVSVITRAGESVALRRAAVERLAVAGAGPESRAAIAAALPSVQNDLALAMAAGLAKNDSGAGLLVDLVRAGRAPAQLLRHRYVAMELERRPASLQAQAAELTRNLPPEDARLDALVAQRVASLAAARPDPGRGAAVFGQHCAVCHQFRNRGGRLGPNLDGIAARGVQRLVEDILDPNRNVDPVFRLVNVALRSGETRSGFNLREQGNEIVLTDGAGADFTLARSEVAGTTQLALSPMPAAFDRTLPEPDFQDLIAYLRSAEDR